MRRAAQFASLLPFYLLLVAVLLLPRWASAESVPLTVPIPGPPSVGAKSYMLMDYTSGQIIAARNEHERVEPASLTKLMSAYVVFNELKKGTLKLDETVRVSTKAWRTGGSRMFIQPDVPVKVSDLIQGLIVVSGNDATVALAERVAGTEEAFVDLMNAYARQLGMRNTHFANADGLPVANHYSSAYDLALLARAIIRDFPQYFHWYSQKSYSYNNITQPNRNLLLYWDPSVDGMKTGFTDNAKYCLVSTAKRGQMRLISVVLGTDSPKARAQQSQSLLNYGFRFYESRKIYSARQPLSTLRVWKGDPKEVQVGPAQDVYAIIPSGRAKQVRASLQLNPKPVPPIKRGQALGQITVRVGDKVVTRVPAVALQPVEEAGLIGRTIDTIRMKLD
ncbi:MAG: D-alanyl-D-alanine carboxypeptidase family protein [Pseudomonadota bacterium]